ncbi:MAG: GNAT family N-acetyltransferase [Chloroflexi bacterium]|nr:GNAT family N-acetyltransferase [Chloroflexota bacterium]
MGMTVQREDFASLSEEHWQDLLAESATDTIFLTHAWQRLWWEHYGEGKALLLLSVRAEDGRLAGIAPLVQDGCTIQFGGGADVSDYLDVIARPEDTRAVWTQVLCYLQGEDWTVLDFRCIPAASPSAGVLPEVAADLGWQASTVGQDVCPILELPESWDAFLARLRKKDRHELRRKLRRLEAAGPFCAAAAASDGNSEALAKDMSDFFRLHRLSREEKAAFMTPDMEAFFRAIAAHFVPLDQQRTFFLEFQGERVAAVICFDYGSGRYLYNSGYDHAYAHLSVGLLLKALCIQDTIAAGKPLFDFLRGNEPYKYDLGGRDVPIFRCVVQR